MWSRTKRISDCRSGRLIFVIECLLNQNARDRGAAERPAATADRIQCYVDQGFEVLAVVGGNEDSPGCAVHVNAADDTQLTERSGVFMRELAEELARRSLQIEFHGMRDADSGLLHADLEWLRDRIS